MNPLLLAGQVLVVIILAAWLFDAPRLARRNGHAVALYVVGPLIVIGFILYGWLEKL